MFKYIFQLTILSGLISAQAFEVQNVTASQRTDGSHIVDVCYDLAEDDVFVSFTVYTSISLDGGMEWLDLVLPPLPNVLYDNVTPGENKCFSFNLNDYVGSQIFTSQAQIKIIADGHEAIELPFEMVSVASGPFLNVQTQFENPDLGYNAIENITDIISYDYEIMKYEVTNAQFAQFLIESLEKGLLSDGCGHCYGNPIGVYYPGGAGIEAGWTRAYSEVGSSWYPETTGCKIHWNGTTFIVAEGFGNHPVSAISWIGAWAFSHYYGLRLPTKEEWLKAARGNNDWGFSYGSEPSMYRANTNGSGDPWDGQSYTNKTTPVGFYNGQNYNGYQTIDSPSPYGTYDQDGNVSEYTYSWQLNSGVGQDIYRLGSNVNMGYTDGFFHWSMWYTFSGYAEPSHAIGFRCARTISNSQ